MWDGNAKRRPMTAWSVSVEREPMWDGNVLCVSVSVFSALLSENQCGMETGNERARLLMRLWLSENQCGMETSSLVSVLRVSNS